MFPRSLRLTLLLSVLLAACAAPSLPVAVTPSPTDALTVTDALGRQLTFARPPERILIAGKASLLVADALYAFPEARQRVIALPDRAQTPEALDFLRLLDPHLEEKLILAADAGPEQIAALHPDVVVMKRFLARKLGASVEALGIPVFYVSMETPEEQLAEWGALGALFGNPARAQVLQDYFQRQIQRVQARATALPSEQQPRVLLLQHTSKGGSVAYRIPPADWLQAALVRLAGGQPVWADANPAGNWEIATLEQIAAWQPEQIYIVDYFDDPSRAVAAFRANPIVADLPAVRRGEVYPFPKDFLSWDQPDTRWVLGMLWLARHIHPQTFADVDLRAEVEAFYRTVYGLEGDALEAALARYPQMP